MAVEGLVVEETKTKYEDYKKMACKLIDLDYERTICLGQIYCAILGSNYKMIPKYPGGPKTRRGRPC